VISRLLEHLLDCGSQKTLSQSNLIRYAVSFRAFFNMRKIGIIGVPSSAEARQTGQERVPQSFRRVGFIEHLHSAGLELSDFDDLLGFVQRQN